ncbi:DUF4416 family protein [Lignipirellula cremea]|uniref:GTP-binding protein n=1 Tax=Lignipirellula cremea TaxID=2528010 RepID=A0A518E2K1_9BACT|nr:DUF4416 family protein [Lignipirellula cremea]QDU98294.1 hypothetical protein Pla8534_61560 [Lignipirellula cremea]
MGQVAPHQPVLRILAAFSRYEAALDWARVQAVAAWGPIALESDRFPFVETDYYQRTMGDQLLKTFFAFEQRIDPAELVDAKLASNDWEEAYCQAADLPESRPLNLDPGYISPAKLVLATTKDRDHRLYLDRGIYAEVTLHFKGGVWTSRDWTYPDYKRPDFQTFFTRCREYLRRG